MLETVGVGGVRHAHRFDDWRVMCGAHGAPYGLLKACFVLAILLVLWAMLETVCVGRVRHAHRFHAWRLMCRARDAHYALN